MNTDFKRLTFIDSFWNFFNGLIAPFLTIYFNNFGGFDEIGISVSIKYLIQGILPFVILKSLNGKKKSMKKMLLIGQIIESVRILFFIFARNIFDIYIIQLVGGISYAFISPAYGKIFVKTGEDENDSAFSKRVGVINLVIGISALASGFFINIFGFVPVFIFWSLTELVYGLFIFYMV